MKSRSGFIRSPLADSLGKPRGGFISPNSLSSRQRATEVAGVLLLLLPQMLLLPPSSVARNEFISCISQFAVWNSVFDSQSLKTDVSFSPFCHKNRTENSERNTKPSPSYVKLYRIIQNTIKVEIPTKIFTTQSNNAPCKANKCFEI